MGTINVSTSFEPRELKAYAKNETVMTLRFENTDAEKAYWCECDVKVESPLSLEHDGELSVGRTRIGILPPKGLKEKQVRLYTRPNNFPDEYRVAFTVYAYDEDGAVSDRVEGSSTVQCVDMRSVSVGNMQ